MKRRAGRGPHPEDGRLFADAAIPRLRRSTAELSWLLSRGYAPRSSLKLVGDRHRLTDRQRVAVARCACDEQSLRGRAEHEVSTTELCGEELWIDGFNVITSLEAALAGGVILRARDGCYRDMAGMHGSYRRVEETIPAIRLLGQTLAECRVGSCRWLLDQPVSNSGRLAEMLRKAAAEHHWPWQAEVVADPDRLLTDAPSIVTSSDSSVLDHAPRWFNLVRTAIDRHVSGARIVDLSAERSDEEAG